jgi:hypothetical protein
MMKRFIAQILVSILLTALMLTPTQAQNQPGRVFPIQLDSPASLVRVNNRLVTKLTASLTPSSTTASVVSTAGWPSASYFILGGIETVYYTGTTPTSFTGLLRAREATTATAFPVGGLIEQRITALPINIHGEVLIELEKKMGYGADLPGGNNEFFISNEAGQSTWRAMLNADVVSALGFTPINKAGDSFTGAVSFGGAVTLAADPTLALHAATKQYVDAATGVSLTYSTPVVKSGQAISCPTCLTTNGTQVASNKNLTVLKGLSGTSTEAKNLRGVASFTGSTVSVAVTFPVAEPDNAYYVVLGVSTNVQANYAVAARAVNPQTTGFTVEISAAPGTGNTISVNWMLVR